MARSSAALKRATNVSLNGDLIDEAKRLDINISQACERGLEQQVAKTRADKWREENREGIEFWNSWVRENGMPYDEFRQG